MLQVLNSAANKQRHDLRKLSQHDGLAIMRKYASCYPPRKLDKSYYSNEEIANLGWDMLKNHLQNRFSGSLFFR
jgi:hypothetical protein